MILIVKPEDEEWSGLPAGAHVIGVSRFVRVVEAMKNPQDRPDYEMHFHITPPQQPPKPKP